MQSIKSTKRICIEKIEIFDNKFFDNSIKHWQSNKYTYQICEINKTNKTTIFKNTGMAYYKTNSDSPLQFNEYRCKNPYPNANNCVQCEYIASDGCKCIELCYLDKLDIDADCEIYTKVKMCSSHQKYILSEQKIRIEKVIQAKAQLQVCYKFTVQS